MALPQWITPSGFLGTATERTSSTFILSTKSTSTFSLISGTLPSGMSLTTTGTIAGSPFSVGQIITSQFVVRAANGLGITDRTFIIDTQGATDPIWITPAGYLALGISGQSYIVNKSYVDYQFNAIYDVLPAGQKLRYYIGDLEGTLPPGLTLTEDGRLFGYTADELGLDVLTSSTGGYDSASFGVYPYDHPVIQNDNGASRRPTFIAKIYQFYITVTDGIASARRLFQIKIEDPRSFRVDTTLIDSDTTVYTADSSYLITPTWVSPVNLGHFRANNYQVIQLASYDPDTNTGPTTYDWTTPTVNIDGSPSVHPEHFELDPNTGVLYARLPYYPIYSQSYKFTVRLIKTDRVTGEQTFRDRTFALTIKGEIDNTLEFLTPADLDTIFPGIISELAIVAKHTTILTAVNYRLTSGRLPTGLTLASDGTIIGRVKYNSQTSFDRTRGFNTFTLDKDKTTIDKIYKFTVEATDVYQKNIIDKEFSITVTESSTTEFVQIYIEPYMSSDNRRLFLDFITDPQIFENSLLYRPLDPEFGLQTSMKFVLEHGIKKSPIRAYAANMLMGLFQEQRLLFNGLKTAVSKDVSGNITYEVVYLEVIDESNSIFDGMKKYFNANFSTDEYTVPTWMRTSQSTYGALPTGFVKAIPLCYTLPGISSLIVARIKSANFDFKQLNFTVDRLVVSSTTEYLDNKYLMFPNRNAGGTTVELISVLSIPEGGPLLTEENLILDLEF
jgi:hypothetical protein